MSPLTFGLTVLVVCALIVMFVARARMEAEDAEREEPRDETFDFPLDGELRITRRVRESYDDLPYRRARL